MRDKLDTVALRTGDKEEMERLRLTYGRLIRANRQLPSVAATVVETCQTHALGQRTIAFAEDIKEA